MAISFFPRAPATPQTHHIWDVIGGAALLQALAGLAALGLLMAGWLGWTGTECAAAAGLSIGAGLCIAGLGSMTRYPIMHATLHGRDWAAIASGMAITLIGGAGGALLAILCLKDSANLRLMDASCLIEGVALFLGSGAIAELTTVGKDQSQVEGPGGSKVAGYLNHASILQAILGLLATLLAAVATFSHTSSHWPTVLLIAAVVCMAPALLISGLALAAKAAHESGVGTARIRRTNR